MEIDLVILLFLSILLVVGPYCVVCFWDINFKKGHDREQKIMIRIQVDHEWDDCFFQSYQESFLEFFKKNGLSGALNDKRAITASGKFKTSSLPMVTTQSISTNYQLQEIVLLHLVEEIFETHRKLVLRDYNNLESPPQLVCFITAGTSIATKDEEHDDQKKLTNKLALNRKNHTFQNKDCIFIRSNLLHSDQVIHTPKLGDFSVTSHKFVGDKFLAKNYFCIEKSSLESHPIEPKSAPYLQTWPKPFTVKPRLKTYLGSKISAVLKSPSHDLIMGDIVDISDQGIGILVKGSEHLARVDQGEIFDVKIQSANQNILQKYQLVNKNWITADSGDYWRLGLKLNQKIIKNRSLRKMPRLSVQPHWSKVSAASTDSFLGDSRIEFEITSLSNQGMTLKRLNHEDPIVYGMTLNLKIQFPNQPPLHDVTLEINYVSPSTDGTLGAIIKAGASQFQKCAGGYLLKMDPHHVSLLSLKNMGFATPQLAQELRYCYAKEEGQFAAILRLRLKSFQHNSSDMTWSEPWQMQDAFDSKSRHIAALLHGNLIASSRIVFHDGKNQSIEHASYGCKIPDWLSNKKFVEYSRIVIDPEFRGSDVLVGLLSKLATETMEAGYDYVVMSCTVGLMTYYKRFGFKKIETFYMDGEEWILSASPLRKIMKGDTLAPIAFAMGLDKLTNSLQNRGIIKKSLRAEFNAGIMKISRPVIHRILAHKRFQRNHNSHAAPFEPNGHGISGAGN